MSAFVVYLYLFVLICVCACVCLFTLHLSSVYAYAVCMWYVYVRVCARALTVHVRCVAVASTLNKVAYMKTVEKQNKCCRAPFSTTKINQKLNKH